MSLQHILIGLATIILAACNDVRVVVENIPKNTPAGSSIYIAGNFNYWDPGDNKFRMNKLNDSTFETFIPRGFGDLKFKFTRGDWTTVEKAQCGEEIFDRTIEKEWEKTHFFKIESWSDQVPLNCEKITFLIANLPENTPKNDDIFMTGDCNNWAITNYNYKFKRDNFGNYFLDFPIQQKSVEFKLTRGEWSKIEVGLNGEEIKNRFYKLGSEDTILLHVAAWKDLIKKDHGSLTIFINKLPKNTPKNATLYFASNMNSWNEKDEKYRLQKNDAGNYFITIPKPDEDLFFKFTLGGWRYVECNKNGKDIENRVYKFNANDTLRLNIESWKNI